MPDIDYPLILTVTFLSTFALISPAFASYISAGESTTENYYASQTTLTGDFDPYVLSQYSFYHIEENTSVFFYELYEDNFVQGSTLYATVFKYKKPTGVEGDDEIRIWGWDNDPPKFRALRSYTQYWIIPREATEDVSITRIAQNWNQQRGASFVTVDIDDKYTLVFKPTDDNIKTQDNFKDLLRVPENVKMGVSRSVMDQAQSSTSGWNIIGSILMFNSPDIHPLINSFVAIPLWVAIAYLSYRLILLALPFVG